MRHIAALFFALALITLAFGASAEAFTPITVQEDNYLSNLDVCIASVNEIRLDTDETFSFNGAVGARSVENGYCEAVNGRGVEVVGGGVTQIATTIYLAIKGLDSMEIVEKQSYASDFCEGYVADHNDAVITDFSQPLDFRFTNHGERVTLSVWRDEENVYCCVLEEDD